jgi:HK97 family phage portal protein
MDIKLGFGRYKRIAQESRVLIEQQKALLAEMEIKVNQVTDKNLLYRSLYQFLSSGLALGKDSHMKDYVREGYEGNPDLFSIVTRLAGMFAQSMANVKLVQSKNGKEEEIQNDEISSLFDKINYYQTFYEFCRHWAISFYVTGNGIVYAPRLTSGMNQGKLTGDGMIIMPTQNVIIYSKGWRQPLGEYTLDINETYKIDARDVWHERLAPTMNYEEGKNFMGMSPVKVASDVINAQNKGFEITSKMYAYGHPPGILSKEVENGDETTAEQESKFRERYRTKYQGVDNMAIPIFTLGKLSYTKIGYDNLKELELVSMSEHGMRTLCRLLQVPSQLFNDTAASTYNNMMEASKMMYTNRLIPDIGQFCQGFNRILRAYGDFKIKPDFSDIEALQEDKVKKSEWISRMFRDGVITGDDYLRLMGEEPTGLPEMQLRYTDVNRIPLNATEDEEARVQSDKFYQEHGLSLAM